MKIVIYSVIITVILAMTLILTGCSDNNVEPVIVNTVDVGTCMFDVGANNSVKGECLTYYYRGPEDLTLYYTTNWNKGFISMKKYYVTQEKYLIEKPLYPNATRVNDTELTIQVQDYMKVEDMDAYWNQIETSSTYVMVK